MCIHTVRMIWKIVDVQLSSFEDFPRHFARASFTNLDSIKTWYSRHGYMDKWYATYLQKHIRCCFSSLSWIPNDVRVWLSNYIHQNTMGCEYLSKSYCKINCACKRSLYCKNLTENTILFFAATNPVPSRDRRRWMNQHWAITANAPTKSRELH